SAARGTAVVGRTARAPTLTAARSGRLKGTLRSPDAVEIGPATWPITLPVESSGARCRGSPEHVSEISRIGQAGDHPEQRTPVEWACESPVDLRRNLFG